MIKLFRTFAVLTIKITEKSIYNKTKTPLFFEIKVKRKYITMKKFLLSLVLSVLTVTSFAQKIDVSGIVMDGDTREAIMAATVQILNPKDSSMVGGAATDSKGAFKIKNVKKGKYVLKVSYIGYNDHILPLDLSNAKNPFDAGYVTIRENSRLLKETVVSAAAAQVQVVGDSVVYNASAYRTPEGSMLEDLIKKLPGATMDDDGTIKINGKTVNKILVDGKEFFLNDKEMALKNIPTNIIDKLKTYDRKSDLARVTGIDDGEEETVIDLSLKKGMNQGWFGNADLAGGTQHRYSARVNLNRFLDGQQYSLVGNANNVGGRGFGGGGGRGGGWGRGGNGLRSNKDLGFNFATGNDIIEVGGNVRYRYNGSDAQTISNTEKFSTNGGASQYTAKNSNSWGSNYGLNADFRMEWKPDSLTNIIFRPSGNISRNRSKSSDTSATFNGNPYDYSDNPLEDVINTNNRVSALDSILVTSESNLSQSYSLTKSLNGELQVNRKLNDRGRNITFRATGSVSSSDSKSLSASSVVYTAEEMKDNSKNNNRYQASPGKSHSYSLMGTYSEPIADRTYLQFSYRFNYSYNKSDRKTGVFDSYDPTVYNDIVEALNANRYNVAGALDQILTKGLIPDYDSEEAHKLAQYSEYRNYDHTASISFRKVTDLLNFSAGVDFMPQHSTMDYKYMNVDTLVSRSVFNFAPHVDLRVNFDKQTTLRVNYRSRSSQPSMTNLLDIRDDSRPNQITLGNPGLKPQLNHNFGLNFNTFAMEAMRSIFVFGNGSFTQNAITNVKTTFTKTGQEVTKPMNITGSWNAMLGFGYNQSFGPENLFSINSVTTSNYNHQVSYLSNVTDAAYTSDYVFELGEKTASNSLGLGERLSFGYRKNWFEASLNGNVNYTHARNSQMASANRDSWDFSYGAEFNFLFDWGTSLSTDISESSRRGYSTKEMNTNELLWNIQVSQSFLKGKALTVSLQWNDILGQQSNISRTLNALQQSDSRSNAIYSYGMIHVIYKLNIFGGKNANGTDQERVMTPWGTMRPGDMQGGPGGRGGNNNRSGNRGGNGSRPAGGFGGGFGGGRPF